MYRRGEEINGFIVFVFRIIFKCIIYGVILDVLILK